MQAFRFGGPAVFSENPGSTQVLGRGGRGSCQPKQANCTWGLVYLALLFPAQKPGSQSCALWSSLPPLSHREVASG